MSPNDIATACQVPLPLVEKILSRVDNPRVSDPVHLLTTGHALPGRTPADIQFYWLGFLKAAGHVWGQGPRLALVVTLGDDAKAHMKTLLADLADPVASVEFCRSSLLGWQLYVRDPDLCRALIPWGITSDSYGDDPGLIDDMLEEFAAPFMHGFLDGNWPGRRIEVRDDAPLTLYGPVMTVGAINKLIQRCWRVAPGIITEVSPRARLYLPNRQAARVIRTNARSYTSRSRRDLVAGAGEDGAA